jgi:hypothetical protein
MGPFCVTDSTPLAAESNSNISVTLMVETIDGIISHPVNKPFKTYPTSPSITLATSLHAASGSITGVISLTMKLLSPTSSSTGGDVKGSVGTGVGFIVGIAVGGIVGGFLGLGLLCPSIIDSTRLRTTRENIIFILSLMMELWQP